MLAPTNEQKLVAGISAASAGIVGIYSVYAAWPASWFPEAAPVLTQLFLVTAIISGAWFGLAMQFIAIPAAKWVARRKRCHLMASVAGTSAIIALSGFALAYLPLFAMGLVALVCISLFLRYPPADLRMNV